MAVDIGTQSLTTSDKNVDTQWCSWSGSQRKTSTQLMHHIHHFPLVLSFTASKLCVEAMNDE